MFNEKFGVPNHADYLMRLYLNVPLNQIPYDIRHQQVKDDFDYSNLFLTDLLM